jgi:acyl carrier protein
MKEKLMEMLLRVNSSIDPESVTMESDLQGDLGLQSFELVLLLMDIEDTFHVTIGEDAVFQRVADVCAYLREHGVPD